MGRKMSKEEERIFNEAWGLKKPNIFVRIIRTLRDLKSRIKDRILGRWL